MQARLEARHLTKYYSAIPAIRDVSFALAPGNILGLLGPNGSGKSTTISLLTGLREPSIGQILFDGHDITDHLVDYKARVGYVPEDAHLYTFLSGREQLDLVGRLRRLPSGLRTRKIAALLDLFGLTGAADQPISGYSKGMRQKILIVSALLHDPDLLILDEPESGLDLSASLTLRHLIPMLAARGKAIVYSSHILDYVERLCADVVVLHRGRIVAAAPVKQLRALMQRESSLEDIVAQLVTTTRCHGSATSAAIWPASNVRPRFSWQGYWFCCYRCTSLCWELPSPSCTRYWVLCSRLRRSMHSFLPYRKLPFACSYVPIENPKIFWPAALVTVLLITYGFADLERLALRTATRTTGLGAALSAIVLLIKAIDRTNRRERLPLNFDERPAPATQRLGLFERMANPD